MRTRMLMIAALLISFMQVAIGQHEKRSVLLPSSESKTVSDYYSSVRSEKIGGSWQPSKADLEGIEASLSQIPNMKIFGWDSKIHIDHPDQYYRQYIAVLVDGKRMIFVNAFRHAQEFPNWHDRLVIVTDGDINFWQALYDPSTMQFSNLRINFRA